MSTGIKFYVTFRHIAMLDFCFQTSGQLTSKCQWHRKKGANSERNPIKYKILITQAFCCLILYKLWCNIQELLLRGMKVKNNDEKVHVVCEAIT